MSDFLTEKDFYAYSTAAVSSDGKSLAAIAQESGDDASRQGTRSREFQILLWDLPTGKSKLVYSTKEHTPFKLAFSPDGRRLAGVQQGKSQVWLFDVQEGKLLWTKERQDQGITDPVVVFSHDSQRVIELEKHQLCIRRCEDGETEKDEGLGESFAYTGATSHVSSDNRKLVLNPYVEDITIGSSRSTYSQQPIRVYDLKEMRWQFQIPQAADPCPRLRISANGDRIVTFSSNQVVELWENGRSLSRTQIPGSRIQFLALNPDGHSVVIQRQDNSLMRIDLDQDVVLPRREQPLGNWMLSEDGLTLYVLVNFGNEYLESLDAATLKNTGPTAISQTEYESARGQAQMHPAYLMGAGYCASFTNGDAVLLDSSISSRVSAHQ